MGRALPNPLVVRPATWPLHSPPATILVGSYDIVRVEVSKLVKTFMWLALKANWDIITLHRKALRMLWMSFEVTLSSYFCIFLGFKCSHFIPVSFMNLSFYDDCNQGLWCYGMNEPPASPLASSYYRLQHAISMQAYGLAASQHPCFTKLLQPMCRWYHT